MEPPIIPSVTSPSLNSSSMALVRGEPSLRRVAIVSLVPVANLRHPAGHRWNPGRVGCVWVVRQAG
jgi:hypothetical protein